MNRREILKKLEIYFGVKPKYLSVPTFAYQIEYGGEVFTIDRDGKITDSLGTERKLERLLNQYDTAEEIRVEQSEVVLPFNGHSGITLKHMLNMIYSKQSLIKKAFEIEEDFVEGSFIVGINESKIQTLKEFKIALDETTSNVIRFDFESRTVRFKLLETGLTPEKTNAGIKFVGLLSKCAMNKKNAFYKVTVTDNEKYSFRTWLLRLGFIGDDYTVARKYLMKNFEGDGSNRQCRRTRDVLE